MEWLIYLLKVSACNAMFFAFYLLVLKKLTFFKFNRFYLLLSLLLSFLIPALQLNIESTSLPMLTNTYIELDSTEFLVETLPLVSTTAINSVGSNDPVNFNWFGLLLTVYLLVAVGSLCRATWRLSLLFRHASTNSIKMNGLKVISKDNGFTNCSFFNYVFVDNRNLSKTELEVLLAHEKVHAKQYHSLDKLMLIIVKVVLWFNPVVYLYDKALEQAHEYEADEVTSNDVGAKIYATLLLNLAVSKSTNPLIHHFVKSPVKKRIKMLFNSKSKKMKKLIYLLALPVGLGLTWGFTVKITPPENPLVQQKTVQLQDTLVGKTVKGKVISFEKVKMIEVLNLQVGNAILPIGCFSFKSKVNIGDEITVVIGGSNLPPPPIQRKSDLKEHKNPSVEKVIYLVSKATGSNWVYSYEKPQYAFAYEANRARYAWSTIKSIEKSANGTINRIVLNDKGFTINLDVAAQQFKSSDFKEGDAVEVKFIGEKLTGSKTYTTNKMIALYSWPKKYELINKALYPKFYDQNGKQKVKEYNSATQQKVMKNGIAAKPLPINAK